jgi:hypothetical protein
MLEHLLSAIRELSGKAWSSKTTTFPDFKTVNHVCVLGTEKAAWFQG